MVRPPICAPITLRVLGGLFGRIGRCPPVRADIGRAWTAPESRLSRAWIRSPVRWH